MSLKKKKAFTLVELIITIFIISLVLSIVTVSVFKTRESARNNQRVQNILEIQLALEEYYLDHNHYPSELLPGEKLEKNEKVYLDIIPHNPRPQSDGSCPDLDYIYTPTEKSYELAFCLSQASGKVEAGNNCAYPYGIMSEACNNYPPDYDNFICGQALLYAGESYPTVLIGGQCWFQKNLNVGTMVDGVVDQSDNSLIEKYCYDNNPANCSTYGGLYQWEEAMNYETGEDICPPGWHIPSDDEWTELTRHVINDPSCDPDSGCPPAGAKLKDDINWNGDNDSGFTALAAGSRMNGGAFYSLGDFAFFWSSTESILGISLLRYLSSGLVEVYRSLGHQFDGFSLRCLKEN